MKRWRRAAILNARDRLCDLESTIHDVLTGRNDFYVKTVLLQDVANVDDCLRSLL